jgi:hypothetical protein
MYLCHLEQRDRCSITRKALREFACLLHPAYVSIRQHTSAYKLCESVLVCCILHTSAYVSIRQHTSAYVSIRQHTSAYVSIRQHASADVSMR